MTLTLNDTARGAVKNSLDLLEASSKREFLDTVNATKEDWMEHAKKMEVTIRVISKVVTPVFEGIK